MLSRRLRWGLTGALVAWTLIRALGLERGWPLVPLLAFTPHVALLAVVGGAVAAWRRWWVDALVAVACAPILLVPMIQRAVPDLAPAGAGGVRLRVLSANVAGNPAAARAVMADIRRWDVDVFSAVELPPEVVSAYDASGARSLFPHRSLQSRPAYKGTGLYSRLPLRPAASPRDTEYGLAAAALRRPGAAPVEIVSIHIPAPTEPASAGEWRRELRALPAAGGSGSVRLLAGDFNATLDHADLRRLLDRGYRDAAEQAGVALRPTWPAGKTLVPTFITIDHVLADRRVRVISVRTVSIPGSDHRGVLTELLLPDADRGGD